LQGKWEDTVSSKRLASGDTKGHLTSLVGTEQFLHSIAAGVVLQDSEGRMLDCNDMAAAMLGAERDELLQRRSDDPEWNSVRADGSPFAHDEQPASVTLRTGEPCFDVIMGTNNRSHARHWLTVNTFRVDLDDGSHGVISSFVDVTGRVKMDRSLKLLTEVNRVMMFAHDQTSCFRQLCNVLVEHGNYALAWIATISDGVDGGEEGGVNVASAAGLLDYLYEDNDSWWGTKPSGQGPPGVALRTGETQVVNDLTKEGWSERFRARALKYGLGSLACIPFDFGERGATLNVYGRNLFDFDEITVTALEEIVREAEFGIAHVRSVEGTEVALAETTAAITSLRATEQARAEAEERYRLAFEENMAPMLSADLDNLILSANDAFCEMIGRTEEELIDRDTDWFTYPEDINIASEAHQRIISGESEQERYVKRFMRKDGRVIYVECSKTPARDASGVTINFVTSLRDITEERTLTEQLSHQALHDPLTGLANRALFEDRLAQAHARILRQGGQGAVLLLDLDDFKEVNDSHGHLMGDRLLVAVARRLELVTRASDTICRFGGDEFLYLADGLTAPHEAEQVAARLLEALVEPFEFSDVRVEQHASVGVVVWDETSTNYHDIVQEADLALYEAKREGKGQCALFTPGMHQQAVNRFALLNDLRHALERGEISMHYQPIVDLRTTGVVGFEALMRWRHPERGYVAPDEFIPLAEQSDLINELGAFALREAITAASGWGPGADGVGPYVTVNLSAHQFRDTNLVTMIESQVSSSGLAPERLVIEITESVTLLYASETISVMEQLNRLGVGFALDDFGTGYSSLSYLALAHPKIIKIDQSFVSPAIESLRNDTLLEAIVTLGQKLDMTMLAEGIETPEQLERLQRLGCELGQGFLFSAALPASEASKILHKFYPPAR
jgi:diguanylate cyclase (GGDEF)-like protein/PAS domain S-box-containing protein